MSGASTAGSVRLTRDGPLVTLVLDRPDKLNALTLEMLAELDAACAALAADTSARVIVVQSASARAFCAGADVAQWSSLPPEGMWRRWIAEGHRVLDRLAALPMPSIAAIDGMAFGGGLELALACDLRLASPRATFALPEVRIGIVAGWGGPGRLSAVVGAPRAKQMALTGEAIDARTALQWGLVNEVVDGDAVRLAARVRELADAVAAGPRIAVQVSKQLIDGESSGAPPALMEALATGFISGTDDLREGVEAFRGKRKPRFEGQ